MRQTLTALITTLVLGACAQAPLAPEAYEFEPDWGYLVVTKDTPDAVVDVMELCRLDETGSYTISISNGFHDCHPGQARGTSGRAITLSTSEGSILTDRRLSMPDGRTAHILPYAPFNQLAIRINPLPGRYAVAAFGARETAQVVTGEITVLDLDARDIVYIGHAGSDRSLVWKDPGSLIETLRKVPGFTEARYREAPPETMIATCAGQGTPSVICQTR